MKSIIVNASGAKFGGAEAIVRTFVDCIKEDENVQFYIISSLKFENKSSNITYIHKETKGIATIFFATIGVLYYIFSLRATKIISFSNVNSILFTKKGITYFHQPKALKNYNEIKLKIYRFLIKKVLRENVFIVQSNYIKQLFEQEFLYSDEKVISCWPGFLKEIPEKNEYIFQTIKKLKYNQIGIVPISYNAEHKNLNLLEQLTPFLKANKIKIISLLPSNSKILSDTDVFIKIGQIQRKELFALYELVDFLIFPSKDETVGLPIFEFIQSGKPAFVYNAPYAANFYEKFNSPYNFILFETIQEFQNLYPTRVNEKHIRVDYSQGEWNKIFNLL